MIHSYKRYNSTINNPKGWRILLASCLLLFATMGSAQQGFDPNITHYMFTSLGNNPGFAGGNDGINITALIRQSTIGFKGFDGNAVSPTTMYIAVDSPIKFLHGGIGASVVSDKVAQFNTTNMRIDYAYKFDLGAGECAAGAQLDILNTQMGGTFLPNETDPTVEDAKKNKNDLALDLGLGLVYKIPDKYYVGFSGTNLLQSKEKKINFQSRRCLFLTGGYNWPVPNHPLFEIQPSVLVRYNFAQYTVDITGIVLYNKKFYGGLAYRLQNALSFLVGFNVKGFRLGIAYDASMIGALKDNSGGVEVMANYCFKISTDKFRKSYKNTRFL